MLTSQAMVHTHKALLGTKHKLAMIIFHAISDEISDEVDEIHNPIYRELMDAYGTEGPAFDVLKFMATRSGQLKALTGTVVSAGGLLWALSQIMNNELAAPVYNIVSRNPHLLPDPGTVAQMSAAGLIPDDLMVSAAGSQGLDQGWATNLVQLALNYPGMPDLLDMLRRGVINEQELKDWAQLDSIPPTIVQAFLQTKDLPLSPADVALAVLRGNMTIADGAAIAAQSGVSAADFNTLITNTGEPPGSEQLDEALRRGFIDQPTYEKGIRESRIRDEWIPTMLALISEPMSVSDAVNAAVQNQLDDATAQSIAVQNGLEADHFPILLNTAGEPLSRGEMLELYNRGEVSQDQVLQAMRESRLKNKYNDLAFALHARLPEPRMLSEAVQFGAISEADAIKYAMDYGYSADVAKVIVGEGNNRRLQTYIDRVASSVETMYENNIINEATAEGFLGELNYSADQSKFILEAVVFRQQEKIVAQGVAAIRSRYIAHHIDQGTASGYLDSLGIPSGQRDQLLQVWGIEESANVRTLTEAQVVKAFDDNVIAQDDAMSRLEAMGYNATDAAILLQLPASA
jgi:hypothetical protein